MGGKGDRWYVALLRGVNVGGHHKLPMKDLSAIVEDAGGRRVSTYIQSGNAVFQARPSRATGLAAAIADGLEARCGFRVPVVLRAIGEVRAALEQNPFTGVEPRALHLGFLAEQPPAAAVAALDPDRFAPDRFAVRGREIYFCYPNGMGRSKLTLAYFKPLGTVCTVRNWNTARALVAMTEA
jgi:uncharacterized protein (DUF1697 family)